LFPVRVAAVAPDKELELFVSSAQWIDALDAPRDAQWQRLADAIRGHGGQAAAPAAAASVAAPAGSARKLALAAGVFAAALGAWFMLRAPAPHTAPPPAPPAAAAPGAPAQVAGGTQAGTAPPAAGVTACPATMAGMRDRPEALACTCTSAALQTGSVWGSGLYTDDSALCRAALHAGVVGRAGGAITVLREPGRDYYAGSQRNGVASNDFGPYSHSIRFAGSASAQDARTCPQTLSINRELATPLRCTCSGEAVRAGTVWGSDPYTDDSALCRAARHAGVVGTEGGEVEVVREPGRDLYVGTTRNGVASNDFGAYSHSLRFPAAPPAAATPPCPRTLAINRDLPTPLRCACSAQAVREGTVWGSDAYTDDSALCRAALHAGAVAAGGGIITVERLPGAERYPASTRNGVASAAYGAHVASMRFR
jgi:hypothetical protein